ncbi:formin-B isoform X8 [Drosophila gunungcola]|uniref:formin-B isoform X8 n=1 Tax=Drosophila gunungcola TaxID=103775 RepID=UPI0022DF2A79|nr:formin-B isoform X8 [Drosophila gunungcola]
MMDAIDIFYIALLVFLMFVLCYKSRKNINSEDNNNTESYIDEGVSPDRQGNAFNVPDEPSGNRYGDIFFIEPGSVEANRIRDQLEKDEKDLPSYDEVMRMCNLTTPTAAAAGTPQSPLGEVPAPIGIAALPAPPYSETDPQAAAAAGGATVIAMEPVEPSTSRAAQTPPSSGGCGPPAPPPTAV